MKILQTRKYVPSSFTTLSLNEDLGSTSENTYFASVDPNMTNNLNIMSDKSAQNLYHEKQIRALCALHTLNNLFQGEQFKKDELDLICTNLSPNTWVNPHKSVLGLGNYDINVIMAALQLKNYEAIWFDKRKDPLTLNIDGILGFIMNIPTDCKVGWVPLPLKRKHWYAIKKFGDNFYNLDSKLDAPALIGNHADFLNYLRDELQSKDKELFIIVTQESSKNGDWNERGRNKSTQESHHPLHQNPTNILENRKESTDSGVMELIERDSELNIIDLNEENSEGEGGLRFS